ncbi:MCE family protein [Nocardioides immobilis]|uniref:MCE family protein n=1 Tax=Nocardioides immobilis TaxID=2049295 RepID=A0A417Y658_9ACTN|nr:MlaD family protein [Nocardioides immobilis]RHW28139.1 MCE family protein [Nocardioides immobilis]
MRINKGPLVKVLAFVVSMGLMIAMVGIVFGRVRIQPSTEFEAVFTDASGLTVGSDVRGNGVAIGSVKSIALGEDRHAVVRFSVADDVTLTEATQARIRYANLTGDRYLDLMPGNDANAEAKAAVLAEGDRIPLTQTRPALDLDQFFQGFDPLMRALDAEEVNELATNVLNVTQGQAGAVEAMLANVGSFTSRLADRDRIIGRTITHLSEALSVLDGHHQDLDDLVVGMADLMDGLAEDREAIGSSLASINVAAADTADLLARIRPGVKANIDQMGELARAINLNETEIREVLDTYPSFARKLGRLGAYGSFFNFYLCGVKLKMDLPGEDLDVYTPWTIDDKGRCGGVQR